MNNDAAILFGGIAIGIGFTVITAMVIAPPLTEWAIRRKGPTLLSNALANILPVRLPSATFAGVADQIAPVARAQVRNAVTPW